MARVTSTPTEAPRSYGANDPNSLDLEEWPPVKRQVYEAAIDLFWRQGFARTSVQEIAQQAGVTKGAVYHYFASKEALLRLLSERALDLISPHLGNVVRAERSTADVLVDVVRLMVSMTVRFQRELNVFFSEWRLMDDDDFAPIHAKRDAFEAQLVRVIERGYADGTLRDVGDPTLVVFAMIGMCAYTHHWWRSDGHLSEDELGGMFARIFCQGLVLSEPRSP